MPYIQAIDRNQMMMCSLDSFVDTKSIARVIDAFVGGLELEELGFSKSEAAIEGRPSYDPRCLLKLYLYGSRKSLRSSRKLAEACKLNVDIKWLLGDLEPDFRTISDFRKDNVEHLKKVFHEFNRKISSVLKQGFKSIDGSKFQANNSKDNNFTANKLDDRIEWLNQHTDEYLRQLADIDDTEDDTELTGQFSREELEQKLKESKERLERYNAYREYMEMNGLAQLSITDADAKLMKNKNGFMVAYNVQTAVDSKTHLINDYQMTNQVTDHGLLKSTMDYLKGQNEEEILEVVADKGYNVAEDMVECLENGIIPHVILPDGQDTYKLEIPYEAMELSEKNIKSKSVENIKKCLRGGIIPEVYNDVIDDIEVIEKKRFIREETDKIQKDSRSEEDMKLRAKDGYFVRDPERNLVYCPAGEVMRQKSIKKNGNIRYANKTACRHCKNRNKCYKSTNEWKEIDFNKDTLEKPNRNWLNMSEGSEKPEVKHRKGHYEIKKIVRLILHPDRQKMNQRMCLSEHPFGTIKRAMDSSYFLLKGKKKVDGEFALFCLGYNIKRAMSLLGFEKLMEVVA